MKIFYEHGLNSKNELVIVASHNLMALMSWGRAKDITVPKKDHKFLEIDNHNDHQQDHKQITESVLNLAKSLAKTYDEQEPAITTVHWISDLNLGTKNKKLLKMLVDETLFEVFKTDSLHRTIFSSEKLYVDEAYEFHNKNHTSPIIIRPLRLEKGETEEQYHSPKKPRAHPDDESSKEEIEESTQTFAMK